MVASSFLNGTSITIRGLLIANWATIVTKWGTPIGADLLQIDAAITNWCNYYKLAYNSLHGLNIKTKTATACEVSKYGVFLVRIFLYSDQKKLRIWTCFTQ